MNYSPEATTFVDRFCDLNAIRRLDEPQQTTLDTSAVLAHPVHVVAADQTPHCAHEAIRRTAAQHDYPFIGERMIEFNSLARQCGIAPGMLKKRDLGEDESGVLRGLHTTLDEMARLLDGLAFDIERCLPADASHGVLPSQIIGLLRQ